MTPLHQLGEFLRRSLQIVPLSAVRLLFVGTLVVLLVWVLQLPKSETTPVGGTERWDENLKVGAAAAVGIQIIIYILL